MWSSKKNLGKAYLIIFFKQIFPKEVVVNLLFDRLNSIYARN